MDTPRNALHVVGPSVRGRGMAAIKRVFGGVCVSSGCRRISAAVVATTGRGAEGGVDVLRHATESAAPGLVELYQRIANNAASSPGTAATLATLIAEQAAEVMRRVLAQADEVSERVLAVGVYDPGLWDLTTARRGYMPLCDAATLAERLGISIVDAFPARDLAQGGLGGPLLAVPLALLVRGEKRPRVLVDLGRTAKLTYVPAGERWATGGVLSFDVGPGTSLLDRLTHQLTEGQHAFDPGGRLAVQGRQIAQLIDHWLGDPYFQRPVPRWHPLGCRHDQELQQTVRMAIDAGWSVRDLLCTACHFIAETIGRAVRQRLPPSPSIGELVVTGGGTHNGMLLRALVSRLPELTLVRTADLGLADDSLDAAGAALLAQCFVDQAPAHGVALTGATAPRVLGRVTPGAPHHWLRLIREMLDNRPAVVPLRSAV